MGMHDEWVRANKGRKASRNSGTGSTEAEKMLRKIDIDMNKSTAVDNSTKHLDKIIKKIYK